jgi:hypothetical protein
VFFNSPCIEFCDSQYSRRRHIISQRLGYRIQALIHRLPNRRHLPSTLRLHRSRRLQFPPQLAHLRLQLRLQHLVPLPAPRSLHHQPQHQPTHHHQNPNQYRSHAFSKIHGKRSHNFTLNCNPRKPAWRHVAT